MALRSSVRPLLFLCLLMAKIDLRAGLAPAESRFLAASDGVRIAMDWLHGLTPSSQVIIVSPGFAQHRGTASMNAVLRCLGSQSDLIIFDYRGNGDSGGEFWFGSKEVMDLKAVLAFARPLYSKIKLLGFSLGAYSALRAASENPSLVDELYLVSCPININAIIWSGGALLNPLFLPFQHLDSKMGPPGNDAIFRWGPLFAAKPSGLDLAAALKTPVSFLSGGRDRLVFESMSRKIYERVPGKRSWLVIDDGLHAEAMFLEYPDACRAWVAKEAGE